MATTSDAAATEPTNGGPTTASYDRVIRVFRDRKPEDWRKLIAFSKQWPSLAGGVLERIDNRASAASACAELEEAASLRRLGRRLRLVHEEVSEYAALVDLFRSRPEPEWESVVASRRRSITSEFFEHVKLMFLAAGAWEDKEAGEKEQEALRALSAQVAALVEAHDSVLGDEPALQRARAELRGLLEAPSIAEADARIDALAARGALDPALMLTLARAYNGIKESQYTLEEVKDVMAHLYFKARETYFSQASAEIRILKYLLTVKSPTDRELLLDAAFQPGPQISEGDMDMLSTTPEALLETIDTVLRLYDRALKGAYVGDTNPSSLQSQSVKLMRPQHIATIKEIAALIRRKY